MREFEAYPFGLLMRTREFDRQERTLDLWELQVCSGTFSKKRWLNPAEEPALLFCAITLQVTKGKQSSAQLHVDVLAAIGMHAVARYYQRSFKIDEATLLDGLKQVGLHYSYLIEEPKFRCETSSGYFCGETMNREGRRVLSVETFLPHDNGPTITWPA